MKLYRAVLSVSKEIIIAAKDDVQVHSYVVRDYGTDVLSDISSSDIDVDIQEISKKKQVGKDEWDEIPYGDPRDPRTIREIWVEIEKNNKDKEYKEWLEKYHMTFDFYKENKNGR